MTRYETVAEGPMCARCATDLGDSSWHWGRIRTEPCCRCGTTERQRRFTVIRRRTPEETPWP